MRKFTKLTSIILVLVSLLTLCSGCMQADTMATIALGVPWAEGTEPYEKFKLAVEDSNLFTEDEFVQIELVTIPEDEEGKKKFLKDMNSDKIAFFFYERDELVTPYIESGKIASLATIQEKYPSCYENAKPFVLDTSTDANGVNHMLPLLGNYQGVFFNEDLFLQYGVSIPKTGDQLKAAIATFAANGITPIAGGFADTGLQIMIDELILMEGGVAEHSYVPKYGVVNSWSRAIADLKELIDLGAFNADCLTTTYEQAQQMFTDGKAAMIVGDSKSIAGENADTDKLGVFSFPVYATGKKEIGDIICNYDTGIYINSQFLKKKTAIIDCMIEFVVDYINSPLDEYSDPPEAAEWSYDAYKTSWSMPANPYTIGVEEVVLDNEFTSPEDVVEEDPTIPEEIVADDTLQERVFNMMENTTSAGRTLATEYKTFDSFVEKVRGYLTNGGDLEALLLEATNTEVAAQNGTTAQE